MKIALALLVYLLSFMCFAVPEERRQAAAEKPEHIKVEQGCMVQYDKFLEKDVNGDGAADITVCWRELCTVDAQAKELPPPLPQGIKWRLFLWDAASRGGGRGGLAL